MAKTYDVIIIGTGQSGPSLAARFTRANKTVAIIERKRFGGTCVNNGCIPTKTLIASAKVAYMAHRALDFGVEIEGSIHVDMKKVKARKDQLVHASNQAVEKLLREMDKCTLYEGHAQFEGPKQVSVNGEILEADHIFINVGARAAKPAILGLDTVDYFDNSSIMDVDFLPEHLIIIGGGYISLEFGQMFRRFGSKVTIIERGPRVLSRDDEDISESVEQILRNESIEIITNADNFSVTKKDSGISVYMKCSGQPREVIGSHLLVATGRVPNTDDLNLQKANIHKNENGFIHTDEFLQTDAPGIFAIGDCNGLGAFTHTSYNDFQIVASNLIDNQPKSVHDRIFAYGLFIDPPLGRVGMTERQVRESGRKALIAKMPMARVGRAKEKGETQGFMKILVDAGNHHIIGAALLGVGCDEIIHAILDIMYAKAPYTVIKNAMHIHPTVAELLPTMLESVEPFN